MTGSADQIRATTYQFDTPNPLDVSIRNQAGSVEITAADVCETTVEIVPNDSKGADLAGRTLVALSEDAGQLRIDVPDRKMLRQPPLEIIVTLPSGSTVDIETATADVRMRGIFDGVIVTTASADVLLGRIFGELSARSASGDVIVATAGAGSVQAKTMSGDVVIGVAPGLLLWLDVHSLSGDIASQLGPDESVDGSGADPASPREPDLRISASTMSGDVILRRGR